MHKARPPLIAAIFLALLPAAAHAYTPVTSWGSPGSGPAQFNQLAQLATDAEGHVYAADGGNSRIQKFAADGAFVGQIGDAMGPGHLAAPYGVATDPAGMHVYGPFAVAVDPVGNVWVADAGNHRVEQFTPDGTYLSGFGNGGNGPFGFDELNGVAVDCHGIYTGDFNASRIKLFSDDSIPACPQPAPASGSGAGGAAEPPRDTTAPLLTLSAARDQRVLRAGGISIRLSSNERTTFRAAASAGAVRFNSATVTLPGGARRTVKLGLSKRAYRRLRASLRAHRTVAARLTVAGRDASGNSSTKRLTITLKR
jgi:NHL repeat-containing protein